MTHRPDGRARMRGASVGAASGALSIAAHGVGGGAMMPSESALVLLIVVSAAVGGAVTVLGDRVPVIAVLVVGQVVGHAVLAIASEHHHGLSPTPTMLAAHAVATVVCALLVRGAVLGYEHALSVLRRILPVLPLVLPVLDNGGPRKTEYRSTVVLRVLVLSGNATRGPPSVLSS
nr:hypothetical protein [Rhodococcus sp. (in: high G+C Gram-positive bacteria)]